MSTTAGEAVIALTRDRGGWRDMARSYQVLIDRDKVGQVQRGQRLEFPVAPGRHEIFLKIDWCTSPVVEVDAQPGEVIELSCRAGGPARHRPSRRGLRQSPLYKPRPISLARR